MPPALRDFFVFWFGASVGSFLNVVIYRVPAGLSLVHPPSRCPRCETPIRAFHNVPIFGWLMLRGRCAACRAPISARYPLIELMTSLLFVASIRTYGVTWAGLLAVYLSATMVVVTFIDIDTFEILDEITLPGIVIGCVLRPLAFGTPWWDAVLAAFAGAAFFWLARFFFFVLRKIEGLGLGDVKLIAMLGACLGLESLIPIIILSSMIGTVSMLILRAFAKDSGEWLGPTFGAEAPAVFAVIAGASSTEAISPASDLLRGVEPEAITADAAVGTPPLPDPPPKTEGAEEDEDDWVPPVGAFPFGPFLAIAGLFQLFFGGVWSRWFLHGLF